MAKKSKPKKAVKAKKAPKAAKKKAPAAKKATKKPAKVKAVKKAGKRAAPVKAKPAKAVDLKTQVEKLEQKIQNDKKSLTELRKKLPLQEVADYTFKTHDGVEIKLSEMFGEFKDLVLVHNMGKGCPYCTLWADGFIGLVKHLENRAAFVVISKDKPEVQRDFYQGRGWNFKMYSSHESTFNRDMNFESENGGQWPGVSGFTKDESGKIYRTGYTYFGPGDDFCAVWPMLDLLQEGPAGWEPKFQY